MVINLFFRISSPPSLFFSNFLFSYFGFAQTFSPLHSYYFILVSKFPYFIRGSSTPYMLRRCMTPNPHSKAKYLSDLVDTPNNHQKESQMISYDSFFYVDKLTNNKIQLGEAKNLYGPKQKHSPFQPSAMTQSKTSKKTPHHAVSRHKQYSQTKEMEEINDCFSIMKSTKLFQMENLKNKLFTKVEDNDNKENLQIESMIKKKKKIRQFIQQYLNSLCLNEFRKYMEPTLGKEKVKLINPNLLNIHKTMSNKITRHNIEKIIDQFFQSENSNRDNRPPINISINDIDFPDQERLKELLMHRMFINNKEFQYLITPGHAKQIYSQIHTHAQEKNRPYCQVDPQINLQEYQFTEFAEKTIPKIEKNTRKKWSAPDKKTERKKKELLLSIETGSIYDFLFLIIRWPSLLHYKDHLGNNLLHIAGKQNQTQIYSLLISKLGVQALRQKNNCGKTPVDISKLYGSFEVQKINEEYQNFV